MQFLGPFYTIWFCLFVRTVFGTVTHAKIIGWVGIKQSMHCTFKICSTVHVRDQVLVKICCTELQTDQEECCLHEALLCQISHAQNT